MPESAVLAKAVVSLAEAGLTAKTIEHYQLYMMRAEAWCDQRGTTLLQVTAEELAAFIAAQQASRGSQRVIRCALAYYWRACDRLDPPLDVIVEPSTSRAALGRSMSETAPVAAPAWQYTPPSPSHCGG